MTDRRLILDAEGHTLQHPFVPTGIASESLSYKSPMIDKTWKRIDLGSGRADAVVNAKGEQYTRPIGPLMPLMAALSSIPGPSEEIQFLGLPMAGRYESTIGQKQLDYQVEMQRRTAGRTVYRWDETECIEYAKARHHQFKVIQQDKSVLYVNCDPVSYAELFKGAGI